MIGKSMRFAIVCTLAFAICGKANRDKVAAVSKGTTEDLEPSKTSLRSRVWRLAVLTLSSAVTSADAFEFHQFRKDSNTAFAPILRNNPLDGTHDMLRPANANRANFAPNLATPQVFAHDIKLYVNRQGEEAQAPNKLDTEYLDSEYDISQVPAMKPLDAPADVGADASRLSSEPEPAKAVMAHVISRGAPVELQSGTAMVRNGRQSYKRAKAKIKALGSSTALIVALASQADGAASSVAANLGDSGFLVMRNRQALLMSKAQQHSFNFPLQPGATGVSSDSPADAERTEMFGWHPGDVIILGTEGLFDNLSVDEIISAVIVEAVNGEKGTLAKRAADSLAYLAARRATCGNEVMRDDIIVVVSIVDPAGQAK